MSMQFRDFPAPGATPAAITAADILALRRSIWQNGLVDAAEAEAIVSLNAAIVAPSREWIDFYVEAISVWLVDQQDPRGYVEDAQADWLVAHLPRNGAAELELLVKVLDKALHAPDHLRRFALDQLERAVVEGDARVTAAEAVMLRKLVFACGGDGPASVSQAEAEALFRIKDACLAADNAPEWLQLFVQGVGNFLQGCPNFGALDRARALELENFMAAPSGGLSGFLKRMGRRPTAISSGVPRAEHIGPDPEKWVNTPGGKINLAPDAELLGRDLEAAASAAEPIDDAEQSWLDGKVQADGTVDVYEQALLDFLAAA